MADFSQPSLTSTYSDMVDNLKARDLDNAIWLDGSTSTNLPNNAKRWNSTNNYFEKFNGSTWSPLSTKYMINVDYLDGCSVNDLGTSTTDIWTASKISTVLSSKLSTTDYNATDILDKLKTVDGAGSGLDADLLDGMGATNTNTFNTLVARDSSGNFSAGAITVASVNGITALSSTLPVSPGAASAGSSNTVARADHVHPLQASVSGSSGSCTGNAATATLATTATTALACSGNSATATLAANSTLVGGFTPVQQGGGTYQGTNKIYIGWTNTGNSKLHLQVDSTVFGSNWPISADGVSTDGVRVASSSLRAGEIGTYALMSYVGGGGSFGINALSAGSNLQYAGYNNRLNNAQEYIYSSGGYGTATGTWVAMGACGGGHSSSYPTSLFLRVA